MKKYAQYCPECYKQGMKSELKYDNSKNMCVHCSWEEQNNT